MKVKRLPIESPIVRKYRELIGVDSRASGEEIKRSYRRLASLYHPDRNSDPNAEMQFIEVNKAYETLLDQKKIDQLNREFVSERLKDKVIHGLNLRFGSFFGYRIFRADDRVKREKRIGSERATEKDEDLNYYNMNFESSDSILDHSAYDSIEVVYGGKFSYKDEIKVQTGFKDSQLGQLPWIILNNQGIMQFFDSKYSEALRTYRELNTRVPNNIIFLYRLGICLLIEAFQDSTTSLFGRTIPDKKLFREAIMSFRKAIAIGESRPVGKQKCITIRKTMAEALERAGHRLAARRVWKEIYRINPDSKEAQYKLRMTGLQLMRRER